MHGARGLTRLAVGVLALGLLMGAVRDAQAVSSEWKKGDFVAARLVSAVSGVGDLAVVPLGLELELKPGWKTYWRSPGDAGLPPQIDWAGSENLKEASLAYPAPHRFALFGLQSFGYNDHVTFPIRAALDAPDRALDLKAKVNVLVCEEICVPQMLDLSLAVPAGAASPGAEAQLIARFQSAVPGDGRAAGLAIENVTEVTRDGKPALVVAATAREPFAAPDAIAEVEPPLALGQPEVQLGEAGRRALITLPLAGELPVGQALAGRAVTVTLVDGERAAEHTTTILAAAPASGAPLAPLFAMLGFALAGGLILNFMPCVLPVLSLKLLSVVGQGGAAPAKVRGGFLATAAGIVLSFLLLAGSLIALKAAGHTIGWGIQFQEPVFVATMIVVVTLFACNLWGFFEVPLPRFIAAGASRMGGGPDDSFAGHFLTGALATLLATPCSAPFLGTAVGFALASGTATILAIFLALGVGLALPYLAIAAAPHLATAMPRPGRWMVTLRRLLGFTLAATAVWLLTVMAVQTDIGLAALVGILALALIGVTAWQHVHPVTAGRWAPTAVVVLSLVAILVPATVARQGSALRPDAAGAIEWVVFDRDRVRGLVAQGNTVFVDVTADWCLTCQANKKLVVTRSPVVERLGSVVAMRADWTLPDEAVSRFLASYGRYGIPFNIVYGPGAPGGIVLPEVLSTAGVMSALDRAAGGQRVGGSPPRSDSAARSATGAP